MLCVFYINVISYSVAQAVAAIVRCDSLCEELMLRAKDASTSSRLVINMQTISLISQLFTETLPIPAPLDTPLDSPRMQNCIWKNAYVTQYTVIIFVVMERCYAICS